MDDYIFRILLKFILAHLGHGVQSDSIIPSVHCAVLYPLCLSGVSVVDVFQQWCGPCRAVVSLFRKIKNELGDDLLHFAIVS